MKKKQLEIALQKLKPIEKPIPSLEQYATPADIAADVLWEAFASGDIAGKSVIDLGCGNGILAIGARLLGAERVVGIDVDADAVKTALQNARSLKLDILFQEMHVEKVQGRYDTVVQNPPFGAQTLHADRAFVTKALELAPRAYSLHNSETEDFISKLARSLGGKANPVKKYKFEIPYAFEFHRKAFEIVSVVLLRFER